MEKMRMSLMCLSRLMMNKMLVARLTLGLVKSKSLTWLTLSYGRKKMRGVSVTRLTLSLGRADVESKSLTWLTLS